MIFLTIQWECQDWNRGKHFQVCFWFLRFQWGKITKILSGIQYASSIDNVKSVFVNQCFFVGQRPKSSGYP